MTTIDTLSQELLFFVRTHTENYLLPIHRLALYRWLLEDAKLREQQAYEWLCINTAEHVYPIWQKAYPYDDLPRTALNMARSSLDGRIQVERAQGFADLCFEKLAEMDTSDPTDEFWGYSAGIAAVEALYAVGGRPPFGGASIDRFTTDFDLDPWTSDTVSWSSGAYGLELWVIDSKRRCSSRLKFWTWWLTECLPATLEEIGN